MAFCHYEVWTTQSKTTGSSSTSLKREERLHGVTVISLITSCGFPSLRWASVTTKLGQRSQGLQVPNVSAKRAEAVISLFTSCEFPSLRWASVVTKLGQRSQGYRVFYVSAKRAEDAWVTQISLIVYFLWFFVVVVITMGFGKDSRGCMGSL